MGMSPWDRGIFEYEAHVPWDMYTGPSERDGWNGVFGRGMTPRAQNRCEDKQTAVMMIGDPGLLP